VLVGLPPARRIVGCSGRALYQRQRPSRLSPDEEVGVRQLAETSSLRDLAAVFGVGHETIRAVLRKTA
jgi:hypothetical protein